jgi:hypothetical protein
MAARERRYPVVVVIQSPDCSISFPEARNAASAQSMRCIDYREDVLAKADSGIILGAYSRNQFLSWLRTQARSNDGLIVDNADDLITTWDETERYAFFRELMRTECNNPTDSTRRTPIVLLSWLAGTYMSPTSGRGQGIAWDPATTFMEDDNQQ